MSTNKSKVLHVEFQNLRFTYINKNLDRPSKKIKMQTLLNKLIQLIKIEQRCITAKHVRHLTKTRFSALCTIKML